MSYLWFLVHGLRERFLSVKSYTVITTEHENLHLMSVRMIVTKDIVMSMAFETTPLSTHLKVSKSGTKVGKCLSSFR